MEKDYLVYAEFYDKDGKLVDVKGINIRNHQSKKEYDLLYHKEKKKKNKKEEAVL